MSKNILIELIILKSKSVYLKAAALLTPLQCELQNEGQQRAGQTLRCQKIQKCAFDSLKNIDETIDHIQMQWYAMYAMKFLSDHYENKKERQLPDEHENQQQWSCSSTCCHQMRIKYCQIQLTARFTRGSIELRGDPHQTKFLVPCGRVMVCSINSMGVWVSLTPAGATTAQHRRFDSKSGRFTNSFHEMRIEISERKKTLGSPSELPQKQNREIFKENYGDRSRDKLMTISWVRKLHDSRSYLSRKIAWLPYQPMAFLTPRLATSLITRWRLDWTLSSVPTKKKRANYTGLCTSTKKITLLACLSGLNFDMAFDLIRALNTQPLEKRRGGKDRSIHYPNRTICF